MAHRTYHFTHYKLDAYRVARELADLVMVIVTQVPKGHHKMVDQIVRAASGTEALIAEGANRYSPKQKRQRFVEARGDAPRRHPRPAQNALVREFGKAWPSSSLFTPCNCGDPRPEQANGRRA
jgi:23S rRNA-intervening sequence protein